MSYWQLKLSQIHAWIQIYLNPNYTHTLVSINVIDWGRVPVWMLQKTLELKTCPKLSITHVTKINNILINKLDLKIIVGTHEGSECGCNVVTWIFSRWELQPILHIWFTFVALIGGGRIVMKNLSTLNLKYIGVCGRGLEAIETCYQLIVFF